VGQGWDKLILGFEILNLEFGSGTKNPALSLLRSFFFQDISQLFKLDRFYEMSVESGI
jgi:hypothetical protein